jgi:hypothetical protein
MRFLFRWAFRALLVFLVLLIALVLLKNELAKALAENRIRARTGLETRIHRVELGLFTPTFTVEGLKIYNPAEFGGSPLVDLPELHLEWRLKKAAFQKLHFKLVRLHLRELNIVENKQGQNNFTPFLQTLQTTSASGKKINALTFAGIDTLNLSLGTLHFLNLNQPQTSRKLDLQIKNRIVTDIHSLSDLEDLILTILLQHGIVLSEGPSQ